MAFLNSSYRTIQSENFEVVDEEDVDNVGNSHRKFLGLILLLVVAAASFATLFAVVS